MAIRVVPAVATAAIVLSIAALATKEQERVNAVAKQCAAEILAKVKRKVTVMHYVKTTVDGCERCSSVCEWKVRLLCWDFPKKSDVSLADAFVSLYCEALTKQDLPAAEKTLVKQAVVEPLEQAFCGSSENSLVKTPTELLKVTQQVYDKAMLPHLADFLGQQLSDILKNKCRSSIFDRDANLAVQCSGREPAKVAVVCPKKVEKKLSAVDIAMAYDASSQPSTKTLAMVKLLLCNKGGDVAKSIDELKTGIYAVASMADLDKELENLK